MYSGKFPKHIFKERLFDMKKSKRLLCILLCTVALLAVLSPGMFQVFAADLESVTLTRVDTKYEQLYIIDTVPDLSAERDVTYTWIFTNVETGDRYGFVIIRAPFNILNTENMRYDYMMPGDYSLVGRVTYDGVNYFSDPVIYTEPKVKRGELLEVIDRYEGYTFYQYASLTYWNQFQTALKNAKAVYNKSDNQTTQREIDKARSDLSSAAWNLRERSMTLPLAILSIILWPLGALMVLFGLAWW